MSEPDPRPLDLFEQQEARLQSESPTYTPPNHELLPPMQVEGSKLRGQELWDVAVSAAESVVKKISVDGVGAQRGVGGGFEFSTKGSEVKVDVGSGFEKMELPQFGNVGMAVPQVLVEGHKVSEDVKMGESGGKVDKGLMEGVKVKEQEGRMEFMGRAVEVGVGLGVVEAKAPVFDGAKAEVGVMPQGEKLVVEKVDGLKPAVGAKDYQGDFGKVQFDLAVLKAKLDELTKRPYGCYGDGLYGGVAIVPESGYEHEYEGGEQSGNCFYMKIEQDVNCTVLSVSVEQGSSTPEFEYAGTSPDYVTVVYAELAKLVDGVLKSTRTGNFVLTIWDINGYACRWPETIGGSVPP